MCMAEHFGMGCSPTADASAGLKVYFVVWAFISSTWRLMSKIRTDKFGVFIIQNGCVVRPFTDRPSKYSAGATIPARHRPCSQVHIVGDETWVAVGDSPERARAENQVYEAPKPISSRDTYHP